MTIIPGSDSASSTRLHNTELCPKCINQGIIGGCVTCGRSHPDINKMQGREVTMLEMIQRNRKLELRVYDLKNVIGDLIELADHAMKDSNAHGWGEYQCDMELADARRAINEPPHT